MRKHFGTSPGMQQPGVNVVPFIIVGLLVVVGVCVAANMTWIGQLMREGPRQEDPMEKMTYMEARQTIESEIGKGLTAVGAKGEFVWQMQGAAAAASAGGAPAPAADKTADQPMELTVNTELQSPDQRRQIIDPIKPYMEKAKVMTLTMNDAKSHATWTYTVAPPAKSADGGGEGAPAE